MRSESRTLRSTLVALGIALLGCGSGNSTPADSASSSPGADAGPGGSNNANPDGSSSAPDAADEPETMTAPDGSNNANPDGSSSVPDAADEPGTVTPADASPTSASVTLSPGSGDNLGALQTAVTNARPGDTVALQDGTYSISATLRLARSGTQAQPISLVAAAGARPVLDFTGQTTGEGLLVSGSYWKIKGLEIKSSASSGVRITGSYNVVENCVMHNNGDAGLYIGISKGLDVNTDGSQAAYNKIINCDSYLNYDPAGSTGPGGNADGFACKLNAGKANEFHGCRSWENSDDGWDLYLQNFPVLIEDCWTWHNGDPRSFGYTGTTWGGNGNGFKVGGGDPAKANEYRVHAQHVLKNCIAFDTKYGSGGSVRAFDRNNNMSGVTMLNCLGFDSKVGFFFSLAPDDGTHHTVRNCVAINNTTNQQLSTDTVQDHDSWNISGLSASTADFQSLDVNLAKGPRQPDGSLPANAFARLVASSAFIDTGVDVGIPYQGAAPDLGPFEAR